MKLDRAIDLLARCNIRDRDSNRMVPFRLNPNQILLADKLRRLEAHGKPLWFISLKARRVGVSSLTDGLMLAHALATPGMRDLILAHEKDSSTALFDVPLSLLASMPENIGIAAPTKNVITIPHNGNKSTLTIKTAGNFKAGRGFTLDACHLCLRGDALIYTQDGKLIPISEITLGTEIRTHTGMAAHVSRIWKGATRPMVELRTWTNKERLTLTPDHKVWTPMGWRPIGTLLPGDEIGHPIRPLDETLRELPLPRHAHYTGRPDVSMVMRLDAETGFMLGLYLAEGWLKYNRAKHTRARLPAAMGLCVHEDKASFLGRALGAASMYSSTVGSKRIHENHKIVGHAYGSVLAAFIQKHFGDVDEKHIPDWIFSAPKAFVESLIVGYLAGDGSRGLNERPEYTCTSIYATSVRAALSYRIRDLIASLGWGWASIHTKPEVRDSRGWRCKKAWILSINGEPSRILREKLELPSVPAGRMSPFAVRYRYAPEDGYVWLRVREISRIDGDECWDIEVAHVDHSFTTVCGAVANSEAAFYGSGGESFSSLLNAVAYKAGSLLCIESTANGMDGDGAAFYQFWQDSVAGRTDLTPVFLSWLDDPACRRDPREAMDAPIDDDERELMQDYKADKGQIAWMRRTLATKCNGDILTLRREMPWAPSVAFTATGDPAFLPEELRYARSLVIPPKYRGRIELEGGRPKFTQFDRASLQIWEKPLSRGEYAIGADAAKGKDGGDYAACVVWRMDGEQVAAYEDRLAPELFASLLNALGLWYNEALINVELTGGYGRHAQVELRDKYGYWNMAGWRGRDDKAKRSYKRISIGWETTTVTRELMFAAFRKSIRDRTIKIHQEALASQMEHVRLNDYSRWMVEVGHDDVLCAAQFGWIAREQWGSPEGRIGEGQMPILVPGSPASLDDKQEPQDFNPQSARAVPAHVRTWDDAFTATSRRAGEHTKRLLNYARDKRQRGKIRDLMI